MMFPDQARRRFAANPTSADAPVQPRAGVAATNRIGLASHVRYGGLV